MEAAMSQPGKSTVISLADRYFTSPRFKALFDRGMCLIEETAVYLDGPGRFEVKRLDRRLAVVYSTESMRLTGRLMKGASWLLLMRSKMKDEMDEEEFKREKAKADFEADDKKSEHLDQMPEKFADLVIRSHVLLAEIRRLNGQFCQTS
jgi:regulator of CtrA degradation